jgi:hypothetical protein
VLTCDVLEGTCRRRCRISATSRIASGVRCSSTARRRKFVNDKEADRLLTREYRKGFEIPASFGSSTTIRRGDSAVTVAQGFRPCVPQP